MIDMNVLMACQLLLEQVFTDGNSPLLQQLYQHLLFDFRIWTKSHFAVCLGKASVSLGLFCTVEKNASVNHVRVFQSCQCVCMPA